MANIRVDDLPEDDAPNASDFTIVDALTMRKTSVADLVAAGRPLASQAEAEAGTNASKAMTPLTTAQAIDALRPSGSTGLQLLLSGSSLEGLQVLGGGTAGIAAFQAETTEEAVDALGLGAAAVGDVFTRTVADITALKALDTSQITTAFLKEAGREGTFLFLSGDYSAKVTADTLEGVYVEATDTAATSGAWVRILVEGVLTPQIFGGVADGTTNQNDVFDGMFAVMLEDELPVDLGDSARYAVSKEWIFTADNVRITGRDVVLLTSNITDSIFQLRGDDCRVTGITGECTGTREATVGNPRYRGLSAAQRHCVVWNEGSRNVIDVKAVNMMRGVVNRGPVVRIESDPGFTGADDDPNSSFDYSSLAVGNTVKVIADGCDFAATGHQQDGLDITYRGDNITEIQGIPPHEIYMETPGTTNCVNCTLRPLGGRNILNGVAHKANNFSNSRIIFPRTYEGAGAVNIESFQGVIIGGESENQIEEVAGTERFAIYTYGTTDVDIYNFTARGGAGVEAGLIFATDTSRVRHHNCTLITDLPDETTNASLVRAEGDASVIGFNSVHIIRGFDKKESFVAVDDALIRQFGFFRTGGDGLVANGASTNAITLDFEPSGVGNWSAASITGSVTLSPRTKYRDAELTGAALPKIYGATTAGTSELNSSLHEARVTRFGDEVVIRFRQNLTGAFDGTGNIRIGPLPYVAASSGTNTLASALVTNYSNITVGAGEFLVTRVGQNLNYATLTRGLAGTAIVATDIGSNLTLDIEIRYRTTAQI